MAIDTGCSASTDVHVANEFQSIILAAGKGSRVTQLLHGKPKCLIPVGNKPLIQYSLEMLIRSNIKETIMIVLDNEEELIKPVIHRLNLDINVDYVSIPSVNDCATADSLRLIKDKIKKDVLILSCDIVSDFNLKDFIQLYRLKDPSFLCLLSSIRSEKENLIPAKKLNDNNEFDFIGLDADDKNRLVVFEPDIMFGETIPFKLSFLEKCPNFTMQTNLLDAHVYICKRWLLNYLDHREKIKSIKGDFIPSIVRKQFRKPVQINDNDANNGNGNNDAGVQTSEERHMYDYFEFNPIDEMLAKFEPGKLKNTKPNKNDDYSNRVVNCSAMTVDTGYCIRVNNWVGFCEANRIIYKRSSTAKTPTPKSDMIRSFVDGLVGSGTVVGEKCMIKRSIIGANCKIGDHVKLTNCIVLDNVTVEDGCVLQGTVICYDAFIGNRAEIKDCIVGPGQKIVALGHYTNESLTEEMLDL